MHSPDEELFLAYRDRSDEPALQALLDRHWETCYRIALAIVRDHSTAEDMVQTASIRLIEAARERKEIVSIAGWLRSVVLNEARMNLRSDRRRQRRETMASNGRHQPQEPVDPAAALRDYTDALPEKLRLPLVLHFGLGLTHVEVGEAMGCPAGTVSSWIRTGLEQLRQRLARTGGVAVPVAALGTLLTASLASVREARASSPPSARSLVERAGRSPPPSRRKRRGGRAVAAAGAALMLAALGVGLLTLDPTARPLDRTALGAGGVRARGASPNTSGGRNVVVSPAAPTSASVAGVPSPSGSARATPARRASPEPESAGSMKLPSVRGRVVDSQGHPVAGARITLAKLFTSSEELPPRLSDLSVERCSERLRAAQMGKAIADIGSGVTTAEGRFSITPEGPFDRSQATLAFGSPGSLQKVPGGEAWGAWQISLTVLGEKDGIALAGEHNEVYAAQPDNEAPLALTDIVLEPVTRVSVLVRSDGVPVENATVEIRSTWDGRTGSLLRTTDRAGVVVQALARSPLVTLSVSKLGSKTEHRTVTDGAPLVVDLVPEALVSGQVSDGLGRPASSVQVTAYEGEKADNARCSSRTITDGAGRFVLHGLEASRAYLVSWDPGVTGLRSATRVVVPPAIDTQVVLESAATLVVEVTRERHPAATDVPASQTLFTSPTDPIAFYLEQRDATTGDWASVASWSPKARYGPLEDGPTEGVFSQLGRGTYRVVVRDLGLAPEISEPVTLEATGETRRVAVALKPGRKVSGTVLYHDGVAAAGASVSVSVGQQTFVLGKTDEDGELTLKDLPPGDVSLGFETKTAKATVSIAAGRSSLDVVFPVDAPRAERTPGTSRREDE